MTTITTRWSSAATDNRNPNEQVRLGLTLRHVRQSLTYRGKQRRVCAIGRAETDGNVYDDRSDPGAGPQGSTGKK